MTDPPPHPQQSESAPPLAAARFRSALEGRSNENPDDTLAAVEALFADAVAMRATDIHIDPRPDIHLVRFRIDGSLYPVASVQQDPGRALVRAICVAAGIESATGGPSEGRMSTRQDEDDKSVRVAAIGTVLGPKVSLRLLDAHRVDPKLSELGMDAETQQTLQRWIGRAEGMVLTTGATGTGKTTTTYAILDQLASSARNVITLEDPVEQLIAGLTQIQIPNETVSSFADGMKSILRHDPDVIFLSEIRDATTGRAAVDASFGGHTLLSTLHARDAAAAVTVLRSLEIHDYEIAASLRVVIAQRLVKMICPDCASSVDLDRQQRAFLEGVGIGEDGDWRNAPGCESCSGTGHRGVTGVFECWELDEESYTQILEHHDERSLRQTMRENGISSCLSEAARKAASGQIALAEAMAIPRLL